MLLKQNRYSEEDIYLEMGWNSDQARPCQALVNLKYTQRCND